MCRYCVGAFLLGVGLIAGCSKDEDGPAGGHVAASQPFTAAAASAPSQAARRVYQSIPASLLAEPQAPPPSARSEWSLLQIALAEGSRDEAVQAYERLRISFPGESRLLAASALQLSDALVSTAPPDIERAKVVLHDARSNIERCKENGALQAAYKVSSLAVHLAGGREAISGDERGFGGWLNALIDQADRCEASRLESRSIIHALDHLLEAVDRKQTVVAERFGRVLTVLQTKTWRCPDVLRALQDRRVQVLIEAGRADEALGEVRALLALSTQDAQGWIRAIDRTASVMTAAGRDAAAVARFEAFQQYGAAGPDGRTGTADDLADPLAAAARQRADWQSRPDESREGAIPATKPTSAVESDIQAAAMLLTAGKGGDAIERMTKLVHSAPIASDRDVSLVMDYLAAAYVLRDGHPLDCGKHLMGLVFPAGDTGSGGSPVWRDAAARFLNQREAMVHGLIERGRPQLALGVCRATANEDRLAGRCRGAIDLAWEACRAAVKGGTDQSVLPLFREFGKTLTRPAARIYRARMAADKYRAFGDESTALAEIEELKDVWNEALRDPELALLHSSCLVRQGRSSEALSEVRQLCERSDPSPEWVYRAQLLLGVIYVQEGKPAEARHILRRMLDENPDRECRGRAITILRKIRM